MYGMILLAVMGLPHEKPVVYYSEQTRTRKVEEFICNSRGRVVGMRYERENYQKVWCWVTRKWPRSIYHKIERWMQGEDLPYRRQSLHAY